MSFLSQAIIVVAMALISISVIPFGAGVTVFGDRTWMQLTDLNIGLLFVLAISSMGVYGIALAGWASNNKYSLLGGLRSSAQMISYELPLSLAIAGPLLLANTLSLRQIVEKQAGSILHWNVLPQMESTFCSPKARRFRYAATVSRICGSMATSTLSFAKQIFAVRRRL